MPRSVPYRPSVLALAVAFPCIAGLSGCGGGGAEGGRGAYVTAINRTQDTLTTRFDAVATTAGPTSTPAQAERILRDDETAVRDAASELRRIDPPPRVERLHGRLVALVLAYAAILHKARGGLSQPEARAVLAARSGLNAAVRRLGARIDATIRALNATLDG